MFLSDITGLGSAKWLVGPSGNLDTVVITELPPLPTGMRAGAKNLVDDIVPFSDDNARRVFQVRTRDGGCFDLSGITHPTQPSGSSVNVAFDLAALGVSPHEIALFAPIGPGDGGRSLLQSLTRRGFRTGLFNGIPGTPRTLTVCHPTTGHPTHFCVKHAYEFSSPVVETLGGLHPEVLVITGAKPFDMALVTALYSAHARSQRALIAHPDLLKRSDLRLELDALIANTYVFQVNETEFCLYTRGSFSIESLRRMADSGARTTIVTRGGNGAVLVERGCEPIVVEGVTVDALNQSGAGDMHLAAFLYYVHTWKLPSELALRMAGWIASLNVQDLSPWGGVPSLEARTAKLREWGGEP